MRGGCRSSSCAATALAVALGAAVSAQEVPRTAWGDPDLQGIWVGSTLTPLERPSEYQGREFLREAEVAALEIAALEREERLLERPAERAPAGGDVDYRLDGSLGYDAFWLDEGTTWQSSRRTSLIVDPPSGRIPYLPTARAHERPYATGPWDSHLDLDTGERCFGDGFPQIWFGDNPNHQIAASGDALAGKAVIVRIPATGRELDQNIWMVKQVLGLPVAMTGTTNLMERSEQGARLFTGGVTPALRREAGR